MRWIRRLLILFALLVLLLVGGAGWLYWAAHQVPTFYQDAVQVDEPKAVEERREAVERVTRQTRDVVERIQEDSAWEYEITPQELNAWLTDELPNQVGGEWPPELADPRVAFEKDRVLLGAMVDTPVWKGVAALALQPRLEKPRTLLLEIESLKIGQVAIPIERLLKEIPDLRRSPLIRRDPKSGRYALRIPLNADEIENVRIETLDVQPERLRLTGR